MGSSSEVHGKRRQRSSRVCQYCQRRKVRCDFIVRGSPCTNCSHFGVECVVPAKTWKFKNGSPVQTFETLFKGCYEGNSPIASLPEWEAVEVEGLFKSIANYEGTLRLAGEYMPSLELLWSHDADMFSSSIYWGEQFTEISQTMAENLKTRRPICRTSCFLRRRL